MRIAVAICTCRRPEGLARLLEALRQIDSDDALDVIIINNDETHQGAQVCEQVAGDYRWPLHCAIEF